MAGVALLALGWRWWRAWFPFGSVVAVAGVALGHSDRTLHGTRSTWRYRPSLFVSGVALLALGGLWWHAWFSFGTVVAAAVCVAGAALGHIDRHLPWQAWHFWHWAGPGSALGPRLPPWSPRPFAWQAIIVTHHRYNTHLCHTTLSHTSLSHTIFLSHTHSFATHVFVTHHITPSFTHTHLCHTPSLTHTIFHTHL